ncbi:MAG TPA: MOSC domain-containing protein [Gaiellaceae bacterium]|nr:MOSC domain-containing protein [Gaiellaceae bacterium]
MPRGESASGRPATGFARDLRACLGEILRLPVPEPAASDDPVRFFGQWLAERNLGLVPVADAAAFDRPGPWIAAVRDRAGIHALVLFGSPPGVWLDPSGAGREGGRIEAGWVVAPLDLHLPTAPPAGRAPAAGSVAAILLAPEAEAPLARVDTAEALPGRGLAGDRYAAGRGTFSGPGRGFELTLVEAEVLDEVGLSWEQARRNLVTRGIALNDLVGRRFRVGAAECVGRRLAEPCAHLERLVRPGLLRPLLHRGGLRADVLAGGLIRTGDPIEALDGPALSGRSSARSRRAPSPGRAGRPRGRS